MIGLVVLLAGCQETTDEVGVRSKDAGFATERTYAAPAVTAKAPAENPINALKREGIEPEKILIPAIGVEADALHLGTTENGEMDVPDTIEDVSWFEPGYKPGENGRAVIAGHVDGINGPAIFWDLTELEAGDEIIVEGNGEKLVFRVYAMESVELELADVQSVFGYRSSPELVLITCSGDYDQERGTREERLIVYTELVEE
ncbi:class F sortase [Planococcus salinarum]|uniref:class F sortase n=1 Tax=Planococcus salinarum TaxID=622695 RepID=UPI000E3B8C95|nr:class F sortase [Planococcus salinarum]TAA69132.1 class F sortase [Planococcus salinarum]